MTAEYEIQISELKRGQAQIVAQLLSSDRQLVKLEGTVSGIPIALGKLTVIVERLYEGCPYREDIARGQNNIKRVEKIEKEVDTLREKRGEDRLEVVKGWAKVALVAAMGGGAVKGAEVLFSLFN